MIPALPDQPAYHFSRALQRRIQLARVLPARLRHVSAPAARPAHLLRNRADIFDDYTKEGFENAFAAFFEINECEQVGDARRWLYSMRGRRELLT